MGLVSPLHALSSAKIFMTLETLSWLLLVHCPEEDKCLPQLACACVSCVSLPHQGETGCPTEPSPWVLPVPQQLDSTGKHILPAGRNVGEC